MPRYAPMGITSRLGSNDYRPANERHHRRSRGRTPSPAARRSLAAGQVVMTRRRRDSRPSPDLTVGPESPRAKESAVRRRLIVSAVTTLVLAAILFALSFVVGPMTRTGTLQTSATRSVSPGMIEVFPEPERPFGRVPGQGELTLSFRFQMQAPAGKSILFRTPWVAAIIRAGQNRTWDMNLEFVTGYTFTVVPRVTAGRWYEVGLQLSNQNQISATVNGRQQFQLTVPNSGLNVSFARGLLGSPPSPTGTAVAVQNFRIAQQTYTVTISIAQIVLRVIAGLLLAATLVELLLVLITSDRSRRLIGAPAPGDDGRRTQPRHARVRALPALPLGLALLAIGVTLLIVATPPENNVVNQDGSFHATIPRTPPRTQNRLSLGSAASIGRSTSTMDVTLSFEIRVGSQQRSKQTVVVTTQKKGNGIEFSLDAKRQILAKLTYAAFENPSAYQISKSLPVGQWTNVEFAIDPGSKDCIPSQRRRGWLSGVQFTRLARCGAIALRRKHFETQRRFRQRSLSR